MRKKLLAVGSALLLVAGLISLGATSASAHTADVSGVAACQADGTYTVNWNVTVGSVPSDAGLGTISVTGQSSAAVVTPMSKTISGNGNVTFTQTGVVGTATSATLTVKAYWSGDTYTIDSKTGVATGLTGNCVTTTADVHSTGAYLYQKLDKNKPASWENSGLQTKILTWDGWSWKTPDQLNLPKALCGAWGVQEDQIVGAQKLFPVNIEYPNNGGFNGPGQGVLQNAKHFDVPNLPECTTTVTVAIPTAKSITQCGVYGSVGVPDDTTKIDYTLIGNGTTGVNTVTATPIGNVVLQGYPQGGWTFDLGTYTDCPSTVVVEDPTAHAITDCGVYGSVTVPNDTTKVHYTLTGNGETGVNTVTATPIGNVVLQGYPQGGWTFDLGTYTECAIAAEPKVQQAVCSAADVISAYVTVDAKTGVTYQIDGKNVTSTKTDVAAGTHTVTATAKAGYTLKGPASWPITIAADPTACINLITHPLVTPVVTSKNLTCDASGSYTLASAEGTDDGIIWTVDGKVVKAGTYPVKSAGSITVTAAPNGPDFGFDFDTQASWVLNFSDAKDCGDLTTLAMTGSNANTINLGLLFAGGLLLLGGALVIAEKRFRFGKN
jgi:hypothetical protein